MRLRRVDPLEMWKNRDAVANILNDNGFEPAPEPGLRTKWSDFFERYCEMMTTAVIRHDEKKTRNAMIEVIYASALG